MASSKSSKEKNATSGEGEGAQDKVHQLRAAPPARSVPPRMIRRTFVLDHALGETIVTIRGPAGAVKLVSSQTSLSISTGTSDPEELPVARPARARPSAPARELSGDPTEPGGTITEYLPGEDEGEAARALAPDALDFLRQMEKSEMHRAARE